MSEKTDRVSDGTKIAELEADKKNLIRQLDELNERYQTQNRRMEILIKTIRELARAQ